MQGLYACDGANISGWDDLEGKRIFNGQQEAQRYQMRLLIKLNTGLEEGKGYTGIQVNWELSCENYPDGSADAFVLLIIPDGRVDAGLSSGDMTIFSLPKKVFDSEAFANR